MLRPSSYAFSESAVDTSTSSGISVVSGGSADTFGSWTELIASTAQDSELVLLQFFYPFVSAAAIRDFRLELAIGAAASEVAIVTSINTQMKEEVAAVTYMPLQLRVPKGSRLSARVASNNATQTLKVAVSLFSSSRYPLPGYSNYLTYGNEVNLTGTAIDPGGSANTKGSWYQIISSTAYEIAEFFLNVTSNTNSAHSTCSWLLDIAIGASSSEVPIVSNLLINATQFEVSKGPIPLRIPIPKGSRVSARAQCSITDATDRVITLSLTSAIT